MGAFTLKLAARSDDRPSWIRKSPEFSASCSRSWLDISRDEFPDYWTGLDPAGSNTRRAFPVLAPSAEFLVKRTGQAMLRIAWYTTRTTMAVITRVRGNSACVGILTICVAHISSVDFMNWRSSCV